MGKQNLKFLFDLKKLQSANDDSLIVSCTNLEDSLSHGDHSDIIGSDLFAELKTLKEVLPE